MMFAGTHELETGSLARAMHDAIVSEFGGYPDSRGSGVGTHSDALKLTWARIAAAIASAVVDHIQAFAEVDVTVAGGGLQQYGVVPVDTLAPDSPQHIFGVIG